MQAPVVRALAACASADPASAAALASGRGIGLLLEALRGGPAPGRPLDTAETAGNASLCLAAVALAPGALAALRAADAAMPLVGAQPLFSSQGVDVGGNAKEHTVILRECRSR